MMWAPPEHPHIVGAVEIARRLGVQRNTVDHWRRRSMGFPPPDFTVGGRPAWRWVAVRAWARGRGMEVQR